MITAQTRIRDLELVVILYEEGNLTQAAKRFGITEPAFSKQLKKIERRIQTHLFERSNGGVLPTASGRSFVAHAIDSIQAFRRAVHDAHESKYGEQYKLRIGASSFLSPTWIELLCSVQLRSYRNFTIEVLGGYSLDLLSQLQHHQIDLALITNPPHHPTITTICLADKPFTIVMRREHFLANRESIVLSDAVQYPWVFFSRNVHPLLHDQIIRRVESEHYNVRLLHQIGHADQAAVLLVDDSLLAWLTPTAAERVVNDDLVGVPLHDSEIRLKMYLASLADNKSPLVSEYVRSFMTRIEEQQPSVRSPIRSDDSSESPRIHPRESISPRSAFHQPYRNGGNDGR